jgi:hypothetical protein
VTALATGRGADTVESWRPSRLRRLAWVTWRQHRATLIGLGLFLAAVAALTYLTGIRAHGLSLNLQDRCLSGRSFIPDCGSLFPPMRGAQLGPLLAPMSIGVFLGAPLLAREYSTGTARFAWTQGTERTQQVVTKLILLGLAALAVGAALGWLAQRSLAPSLAFPTGLYNGWQALPFNATPLPVAGASLLGLAIGVLAGAAARRVVPAMAATAAVVSAVFTLGYGLHDRLLSLGTRTMRDLPEGVHPSGPVAPDGLIGLHQVTGRGSSGRPGSWLNQGWYAGPGGHRITGGQVSQLMNLNLPQLTAQHVSFWVSYQPASRYGLLMSVQASVAVLLALSFGALAVWLVQRRNA